MDLVDDLAARRRCGAAAAPAWWPDTWPATSGGSPATAASAAAASRAPGATTLFEIGSVTKVLTVLLLADLAEQGVVGLGLPFAASAPVPAFQGRAIT